MAGYLRCCLANDVDRDLIDGTCRAETVALFAVVVVLGLLVA